jgi:hypothetical protein
LNRQKNGVRSAVLTAFGLGAVQKGPAWPEQPDAVWVAAEEEPAWLAQPDAVWVAAVEEPAWLAQPDAVWVAAEEEPDAVVGETWARAVAHLTTA